MGQFILAEMGQFLLALKYNVDGITKIAKGSCETNVMRCSNALLMSTLLNRKITNSIVSEMCNTATINNSEVPAIFLHNLSLSIVLNRDTKLVLKLLQILSDIEVEEGREDILSTAGLFNFPPVFESIEKFVNERYIESFDNSTQTAIIILQKRTPPQHFEQFFEKLINEDSNKVREKQLKALKENDYVGPMQTPINKRSMVKIWDNFDVTMYDDGMQMSYGNRFSHFNSYK